MSRIRDAEHSQLVAEMRQRIAELEIEVRNITFLSLMISIQYSFVIIQSVVKIWAFTFFVSIRHVNYGELTFVATATYCCTTASLVMYFDTNLCYRTRSW